MRRRTPRCNSCVLKLGKLTKAATVYRGVSGLLPAEFWTPNRWGVCGGVENGFMSTALPPRVEPCSFRERSD